MRYIWKWKSFLGGDTLSVARPESSDTLTWPLPIPLKLSRLKGARERNFGCCNDVWSVD